MRAALLALLLAACTDDAPLPSCADLGCSIAPSGSDVAWEPCAAEVCYCGAPAEACER